MSSALFHYYSATGSRKCFLRDLAPGTLLIGQFQMDILDPSTNQYLTPIDSINTGILVDVYEVFHSNHRVVHQRASSHGQFVFSALEEGEHRICFTPKSFYRKKWFGLQHPKTDPEFSMARVGLNFRSQDAFGAEFAVKKRSLTEAVLQLNDKLLDIRQEQMAILAKERMFRDQLEAACQTVVHWLLVIFGAAILLCLYQVVLLQMIHRKRKRD